MRRKGNKHGLPHIRKEKETVANEAKAMMSEIKTFLGIEGLESIKNTEQI